MSDINQNQFYITTRNELIALNRKQRHFTKQKAKYYKSGDIDSMQLYSNKLAEIACTKRQLTKLILRLCEY